MFFAALYHATLWLTWMMVSKPDVTISSVCSCSANIESANKHKIRANRPLIRFPLKMWMVSVRQWVQGAQSQYLHLWIEFGGRRTRDTPFLNLRPTWACLTLNWMHTDSISRHMWQYIYAWWNRCTHARKHVGTQTYLTFLHVHFLRFSSRNTQNTFLLGRLACIFYCVWD